MCQINQEIPKLGISRKNKKNKNSQNNDKMKERGYSDNRKHEYEMMRKMKK